MATGLAAQETCIFDLSETDIVGELINLPAPTGFYSERDLIKTAILAERAQPGTAAHILDVRIRMASNDEHLDTLLPIVDLMAKSKWSEAVAAVKSIDNSSVALAADLILPLIAVFSSEYDRLLTYYPHGKDTYIQNIKLRDALQVALSARKPDLAFEIFETHHFGYHTAPRYDETMRGLLDLGAIEIADQLSMLVQTGLQSYQVGEGLSICLERRSMSECSSNIARRADLVQLKEFDRTAFERCFSQDRRSDTHICLSELQQRAEAGGFEIPPGKHINDGISGPVAVKLWTFQAARQDPRPSDVPDALFYEDDFDIKRMHGQMLAALLYDNQNEAFEQYADRILPPGMLSSNSFLESFGRNPDLDLADFIEWSYFDLLRWNSEANRIHAIATAPEMSDDTKDGARRALFSVYRRLGRADDAAMLAQQIDFPLHRLLAIVQSHKAAGEDVMADAIYRVLHNKTCGSDTEIEPNVYRGLLSRMLAQKAVNNGSSPLSLLYH